jgi:alanyl aminopeptidase
MPLAGAAGGERIERLPDAATPLHYALHLGIDPHAERFRGEARIRVDLARSVDRLQLHARHLAIERTAATDAAGRAIAATSVALDDDRIEVRFAHALPAGPIELAFTYAAPFGRRLEGVYKAQVGGDAYVVTQLQPLGARLAFPGFDEPRFKTPFDLSLTVPKADVAVANARLVRTEADADHKTLTFATTRPLPTYLVAFAVGPWDVVEAPPLPATALRASPVPLRAFGPRGSAGQLGAALRDVPGLVRFYEDYTAQPYPFDKLDLLGAPDFGAGAMENAGLIVYRDAYLLADAKAPPARLRSLFDFSAHEIAHQWYGNLVTVPWWNDLWLNEAYATWARTKALQALRPGYSADVEALENRLQAMADDSLPGVRALRRPVRERADVEAAFDGLAYQKGAAVLAMFERWVGEDAFREGMRVYLARHAFGSGSADDLVAALAAASGQGAAFAEAMRSFLDQPGVPLVRSELACAGGQASLTLEQSRYLPFAAPAGEKSLWSVPVCTRFGRRDASDVQCALLDAPRRSIAVEGGCPDWYLPNADARGYYRFEPAPADRAALGAALPRLSVAEQIVYADALSAAFERGALPAAAVLEAMPALAAVDAPQAATALFGRYAWIREHLADDAQRPMLDAWAARLYAPRLRALGWQPGRDEPGTAAALRTRLAEFMAMVLRDPGVRGALRARGRAALGLDGRDRADLARVPADLRITALKVAVQDGGESAMDAAQAAFAAERDAANRHALLVAMGSTREPRLGERVRDYGMSPAVRADEMLRLYEAQMSEPENRAAAWRWLTRHFDAYRRRLPARAQTRLAETFAAGRCGEADAQEMSTFLASRSRDLAGGDRGLARALEGIRRCGALRARADRAALNAWIAARAATR